MDHPLFQALAAKDTEKIRQLFDDETITNNEELMNRCFSEACKVGSSLDTLKIFLPFVNPAANDSAALLWAADSGYTDVVRFLIPLTDPKSRNSQALRWAASNGHTECVRLLLPHSDPKECASEALMWASRGRYREIFDMLYPESDPSLVIAAMKLRTDLPPWSLDMLLERQKIEQSKKELLDKTKKIKSGQPKKRKSKL